MNNPEEATPIQCCLCHRPIKEPLYCVVWREGKLRPAHRDCYRCYRGYWPRENKKKKGPRRIPKALQAYRDEHPDEA